MPTEPKVPRSATLQWVPIEKMVVSELAQRELKQHWVDHIAANLNIEQIGNPVVSLRDGNYYLIDGAHRIEALRQSGWGDQQIQSWCYDGLNIQDEAEKFLELNDRLAIGAYDKWRVALTAGRQTEVDIDKVVRAAGLQVTLNNDAEGAIHAPGTLRRIYQRAGTGVLARTLTICRDSYGDGGYGAATLDGIAHLCSRYDTLLDDERVVQRLGNARGGVHGLLGKAEQLKRATGNARAHCVAAAAVEIYNGGQGGKKLPSWWSK